jgi:cysteine desulfurase
LQTSPSQIFFTSGGTESDNTALKGVIKSQQIREVISSKIEHHAVLHTLEALEKHKEINLHFVALDENGSVDMVDLERLLETYPKALVSLMHGNNEIGNLLDIDAVTMVCKQYGAFFHSDTVQTVLKVLAFCILERVYKYIL